MPAHAARCGETVGHGLFISSALDLVRVLASLQPASALPPLLGLLREDRTGSTGGTSAAPDEPATSVTIELGRELDASACGMLAWLQRTSGHAAQADAAGAGCQALLASALAAVLEMMAHLTHPGGPTDSHASSLLACACKLKWGSAGAQLGPAGPPLLRLMALAAAKGSDEARWCMAAALPGLLQELLGLLGGRSSSSSNSICTGAMSAADASGDAGLHEPQAGLELLSAAHALLVALFGQGGPGFSKLHDCLPLLLKV